MSKIADDLREGRTLSLAQAKALVVGNISDEKLRLQLEGEVVLTDIWMRRNMASYEYRMARAFIGQQRRPGSRTRAARRTRSRTTRACAAPTGDSGAEGPDPDPGPSPHSGVSHREVLS
jgi:hypothetical protein